MNIKTTIFIIMTLLVSVFTAQTVFGYSILVTPQDAIVEPGASLDFEAQAFSENREPVAVEQFDWKITPKNLGTISPEGVFEAGDKVGVGTVSASTVIGGQRYVGMAVVNVGAPAEKGIKITVEPNQAIVGPGKDVNFKAIAHRPDGVSIRTQHVRWMVEPQHLGKINENGQFTAGDRYGIGKVMAVVEIERQAYWGNATVIVSEKPSSAIIGAVVDGAGAPLLDAKITASRIGLLPFFRKVKTAEDGSYMLDKLVAGHYVVKAELKGYVSEYYDDKNFIIEANAVNVAEKDTVESINFELDKGGSISGQITKSEDGSPIENANITAFVRLFPSHVVFAKSDANGNYLLEGLHNGSYVVKANKSGFIGEYYDNQQKLKDAALVEVEEPSETAGIDFDLGQTSAITGEIKSDVDGSPIAKATVYVRALITDTPQKFGKRIVTKTDTNGEYTLQVKAGVYLIEAFAEGFVSEWFEDVSNPSEATVVQVTETEHVEVDFGLAPLGMVSGIVTDQATGGAIMGAQVSAFCEQKQTNHKRHFKTLTDEAGLYTFTGLPTGDYFVTCISRTYLPEFWQEADSIKNATLVTVENGVEIVDINFTLSVGASIAGSVTDSETQAPVVNSVITLKKLDGRLKLSTKSDVDGNFTFSGLPGGDYVARADHQEYNFEWYNEQASLASADTINTTALDNIKGVNFTLVRKEQARAGIAGLVLDAETELPINGAKVAVLPLSFSKPKRITTNEDGSYEMLGLKPGKYIVVAHAAGYKGEFFEDQSSWFNATPVTVSADEVTPDINFYLAPQEEGLYMVSGTVVDFEGTPVEGALVIAEEAGEVAATELSDTDGIYQITALPAGIYKIMASTVSYEDGTTSVESVELSNGENHYDVAITLSSTSTIVDESTSLPTDFSLAQNYPNPFNPTTSIQFALPMEAQINLSVFNILGKEVKLLETGYKQAGNFTAVWDGTDNNGNKLSSGLYIYRLEAQSNGELSVQTKRMIMLK